MKFLDKLPAEENKRKWLSVISTVLIAGILTVFGIYGIGQYGIGLFILTPVLIGTLSTLLYGYDRTVTRSETRKISFLTLAIFGAVLLVCAIEGLICIIMAAPLALLFTWLGNVIGNLIISKSLNTTPTTMILLIAIVPSMSFVESNIKPGLNSVTTSIEINASPEEVWKNVVEFPQLGEPNEFIFKTGISYPINAQINGKGVGAVRHCNFTTGSFVEPITTWNEPSLLKFDVIEQPAPMKELNFWNINAPHLHDYFVSKQGQFKLIKTESGKTILEGTTWYSHDIKPVFYWKIWSDYIIHKIHLRVLEHIKMNSERSFHN